MLYSKASELKTISIHITKDGYRFFSLDENSAFYSISTEDSLLKRIQAEFDTESFAFKLINTEPCSLVAEELFDPSKATLNLRFQNNTASNSTFNLIKSAGLYLVFPRDIALENQLTEANISFTTSHSATELIKRALATPEKNDIRIVSVFHNNFIELVHHKGSELFGYHRFTINQSSDVNYFIGLVVQQSQLKGQIPVDLICYDCFSTYGKEAVRELAQWNPEMQYITELFPFI